MGGSSKKQTIGYKYFLGMHMILCHGPIDYLRSFAIDKRKAWEGANEGGSLTFSAEELFGGEKREGGVSGTLDVEMGKTTQTKNSYLLSKIGADIPSFRGVVGVVLRQCYLGMNPYLKPWSFRAQRIHVRQNGIAQWYDERAEIPSLSNTYAMEGADVATVADTATWHYLNVPLSDSSDYSAEVNDFKSWPTGKFPFGDNKGAVNLSGYQFRNNVATVVNIDSIVWIKRNFVLGKILSAVPFRVFFDNGVAVWVNGTLVYSRNEYYSGYYTFNVAPSVFREGLNTIAIKMWDDPTTWSGDRFVVDISGLTEFSSNPDMNPAHIIRECLTDPEWGMGYQDSDIDDASFTAAADTLFEENMGMSLLWDRQATIESFIAEVIKHIDGSLYVSRTTGKFVLKLTRNDYNTSTLTTLDENNISKVDNASRATFGELNNSVTVNYWSSETGNDASVTVSDTAMIQMQGSVINTTIQYPGFTNAVIATRVAQRDLKSLSTPLLSCTIYTDQTAKDFNIGDVFKFSWAKWGISNLVMRITGIAFGDGKSNSIRITCVQDVFDLPSVTVLANTNEGSWSDPISPVSAVTNQLAFEVPYYELTQIYDQLDVDQRLSATPELGYVGATAQRPGSALNARMWSDSGAGYEEDGVLDFCPTAILSANVTKTQTSWTIGSGVDLDSVVLGTHFQIENELCRIDSLNTATGVINVGRGVLDTLPATHASGKILYFWDQYNFVDSTKYVDGETVSVKLTPTNGNSELPIASATAASVVLDSRAARPYPPGNFKINGTAYPATVAANTDLTLTWAHRDRTQQTSGSLEDTTYGNIGPEAGVSYNLRIYNQTDGLSRSVTGLAGTSYVYTVAQEITDGGGVVTSNVISTDPWWDKTKLVLNFDGANGSTTITDGSGNFLVPSGDVRISNFASKVNKNCGYFDGTTDYLSATNSSLYTFAGDFTLEVWVKPAVVSGQYVLFNFGTEVSGRIMFFIAAGLLKYDVYGVGTTAISSTTISAGVWTHLAVTRSGTTLTAYINGVAQTPVTLSGTLGNGNGTTFGANISGGSAFNGYMDDLRITKGTARYSSTFTVPSAPLAKYTKDTNYTNTKFLMTTETGTIKDDSPLAIPCSVNGVVTVSTSQYKFGSSSLFFRTDTSSSYPDYVLIDVGSYTDGVVDSNPFQKLNYDLTFQLWGYLTKDCVTKGKPAIILGARSDFNQEGYKLEVNSAGKLHFIASTNNLGTITTFINLVGTTVVPMNTFNHIALTRSGTTWRLFLNGALEASGTEAGTIFGSISFGATLGNLEDVQYGGGWEGYIDDAQLIQGALYTSAFTPPTSSTFSVDPYWANVAMLIPFDMDGGDTEFENVAELTKAFTVNGNAQISTAQSKFGGSSLLLNGSGDYIIYPHNTDFSFGTGDFTVELWAYRLTATDATLIGKGGSYGSSYYHWSIRLTPTTVFAEIRQAISTDVGHVITASYNVPLNTWTHFAFVRSGTSVKLYIDGVQQASGTVSITPSDNASYGLVLGHTLNTSAADFNGYIDGVRVTKGGARYLANFAVPTSPPSKQVVGYDRYWDHVSLLLNCNGSNGSTTVTDSSAYPKALTLAGNTQISTTQSKFNGSSLLFDGTGDYINIPHDTTLLLDGDFTIEFWLYTSQKTPNYASVLYNSRIGGTATGNFAIFVCYGGTSYIGFDLNNGGWKGMTSGTLTDNTWTHIALTRSNGVGKVFKNGVLSGSHATFGGPVGIAGRQWFIGRNEDDAADFNGYIDDLRITKGVSRYDVTFTPPSSLPTSAASDASYASVSLLLKADGANGSTTFTDSSSYNHTGTAIGDAKISTAQYVYGGSSIALDGTGDAVSFPTNTAFDLGSTYTVEAWFYLNNLTTQYQSIVERSVGGNRWYLIVNNTGAMQAGVANSNTYSQAISAAGAITPGQWYHVAWSVNATMGLLFINGVFVASATQSAPTVSGPLYIGYDPIDNMYLNGYVGEVRVTKGVARYNANFTPPSFQHGERTQAAASTNASLRFELESVRGSLTSMQKHNHTIVRS